MSKEVIDFLDKCGVVRQYTVRNRPQQNGVAEHANRTLEERITAMLAEPGLPKRFWGDFWLLLSKCGIVVLHLQFQGLLRTTCGIRRNPMLVILGSGGVWHMSIFRRISGISWVHTWKSVFSLVIQMATRAGSFIILNPRKLSSVKGPTLMNDTHLAQSQSLEKSKRVHQIETIHQDQLLQMMEMNKSQLHLLFLLL